MSRMKRSVAVIGIGALAATGLAAIVAPQAAQAAITNHTNPYQCVTTITAGVFTASTTPNYTVTLDAPNTQLAGTNIIVTPSLNVSPANGPVALADYTASNRVEVNYQINGGAVQSVVGAYGITTAPVAVPANGATPNPAPGNITIPTTGLSGGDIITILPKAFRQELTSSSLGGQTGGTQCVPTTAPTGANTVTLTGPAFTKTAVSGQSVTTHGRPGDTVTVSGTNLGAAGAIAAGSVTVGGVAATASTLSVDGSGNLTGDFTMGAVPTGVQPIVITNGVSVANGSITILAPAAASPTSATTGLGGAVAITLTTNTWNPNQLVTATAGASTSSGTANGTGGGGFNITITDAAATAIVLTQGSNTASISLTVLSDKCVAWEDGVAGSCEIEQTVEIAITPGDLSQRHYVRQVVATNQAAVGPGTTAAAVANANAPIANQNSGNQNVKLGSIQTPIVPRNVFGVMNDITVTDTRGGNVGWSLTATMTTLSAGPGKEINANALRVSPACSTATAANAWDYDAVGKAVISGYVDPWASRLDETNTLLPTVAADLGSAAALTAFTNNDATPAVNLCTKGANLNNYGTTSGVFNVTGGLRLTVPAFQATGTYSGIMTVTLA